MILRANSKWRNIYSWNFSKKSMNLWNLSQDVSLLPPSAQWGRHSILDLCSQEQRAVFHSIPQKRDFFLRGTGHHRFSSCFQLSIAEIKFQVNLVVRWGFPSAKPLLMDWRLYLGQRTADSTGVFTTPSWLMRMASWEVLKLLLPSTKCSAPKVGMSFRERERGRKIILRKNGW